MVWIKAIITVLPEIIALVKWASALLTDGYEAHQIKSALKKINKVFDDKESSQSDKARNLNDIFRK